MALQQMGNWGEITPLSGVMGLYTPVGKLIDFNVNVGVLID